MSLESSTALAHAGQMVCRIIIPGWIVTGGALKLVAADPAALPEKSVAPLVALVPVEPAYVLAAIIGIELALAALMITLGALARPLAIGVLALYCLVAFVELVRGNALGSGCFGADSLSPVMMLAINAGLLLAALSLDPSAVLPVTPPNLPRFAAAVLVAGAFLLSFMVAMDRHEARLADADPPRRAPLTADS